MMGLNGVSSTADFMNLINNKKAEMFAIIDMRPQLRCYDTPPYSCVPPAKNRGSSSLVEPATFPKF